ncbi:hypothetical protein BDV19DRAFT_75136 [Aspergillus venezuelensis]
MSLLVIPARRFARVRRQRTTDSSLIFLIIVLCSRCSSIATIFPSVATDQPKLFASLCLSMRHAGPSFAVHPEHKQMIHSIVFHTILLKVMIIEHRALTRTFSNVVVGVLATTSCRI